MLLYCSLFLAFAACVSSFSGSDLYSNYDEGPSFRIAGSSTSPAAPYTVAIMAGDTAATSVWICQGVVIAQNVTLTAASCLYDVATDTFRDKTKIFINGAGVLDKTQVSPAPVGIVEYVVYPGFRYYPASFQFGQDLAMLIPKTLFSTTNVVTVDKKANNNTKDFKSTVSTASWGSVADPNNVGKPMDGPNKLGGIAAVGIMKQPDCTTLYATQEKAFELQPSSACLNITVNQGYCKGDAGAGLFWKDEKATKEPYIYLIAIASEVLTGDCPPKFPSVVTRVAPFLGWISTKTGKKVV